MAFPSEMPDFASQNRSFLPVSVILVNFKFFIFKKFFRPFRRYQCNFFGKFLSILSFLVEYWSKSRVCRLYKEFLKMRNLWRFPSIFSHLGDGIPIVTWEGFPSRKNGSTVLFGFLSASSNFECSLAVLVLSSFGI